MDDTRLFKVKSHDGPLEGHHLHEVLRIRNVGHDDHAPSQFVEVAFPTFGTVEFFERHSTAVVRRADQGLGPRHESIVIGAAGTVYAKPSRLSAPRIPATA